MIKDAAQAFRQAAIEKGDFTDEQRDHQLHKRMAEAVYQLKRAGDEGQQALRQLAEDSNLHVRSWAATELLASGDDSVLPIIENLAAGTELTAFSAKIVLGQYDLGELKSPFGFTAE